MLRTLVLKREDMSLYTLNNLHAIWPWVSYLILQNAILLTVKKKGENDTYLTHLL